MARNKTQSMRPLQRRFYDKAKPEQAVKFYSLYDKRYREAVLWESWRQVRANQGAPGVDGTAIEAIVSAQQEAAMIQTWREQLQQQRYRCQPVRRVELPKPQGGMRPLGIATVADRVVQTAMKLVLEPLFEAACQDGSYGYRPQRNAKLASLAMQADVMDRAWGVVASDFQSYFTTIPHDKLMVLIKERVVDGSLLRMIKQSLKVGEVNQGEVKPTTVGVPQGSPLAPLYSNIYLN